MALLLIGCGSTAGPASAVSADGDTSLSGRPFQVQVKGRFDEPWAMAFEPGTARLFITEKRSRIRIVNTDGSLAGEVTGDLPRVAYGGQGGLGDIAFGPDYANTGALYLSWVESSADKATAGAVVGRGTLDCAAAGRCVLSDLNVIWRQDPKTTGKGHYGHRIAFSRDGKYLFITSGDRQKFDPAQDMATNLGKIIRLLPDGTVSDDNPRADATGVTRQVWSSGHRNGLGLAFDRDGNLWEAEMGPAGGDELNLIRRGANYGWPARSNGSHYDGRAIPDHAATTADDADGFEPPTLYWTPSISPSSLAFYDGALFPQWENSLFIGALSGEALIRIKITDRKAVKADVWPMDARIREVEEGPDGALWLLEDGGKGSAGRLLKLVPRQR